MKKLLVIIAVSMLSIASFAQNGKSIYNDYSEEKNVSAVYISPAMFKMMGKLPDMNIDNSSVNLSSIVKSLSGMYILDSENAKVSENIKSDVDKLVKKGSYEIFMEAKDDGEIVRIFTKGDDAIVTSFLLLTYQGGSCTFICLDGQMPREALEDVLDN